MTGGTGSRGALARRFDVEARADRRRRRRRWWSKWKQRQRKRRGRAWELVTSPETFLFAAWTSLTVAIGWAIGHWRIVIAASLGILLFGLYGFSPLWQTLKIGLRGLSKMPREKPEDR